MNMKNEDFATIKNLIYGNLGVHFRDKDYMLKICNEYKQLFNADLKQDYTEWANALSKLTGGMFLGDAKL